jgi:hypothetical protein
MKRIDSAYKYELPKQQKENPPHYRLVLNKRCVLPRGNHTNRLPINAYSSTKPLEYLQVK